MSRQQLQQPAADAESNQLKCFIQSIVQLNNSEFYEAIQKFCHEKYLTLTEIINMMWIDVNEDLNQFNIPKHVKLTQKQKQMLNEKKVILQEKLQETLNENTLLTIWTNDDSDDDADDFIDVDNFVILLRARNSQRSYVKFLFELMREREKYKECMNFMMFHDDGDGDLAVNDARKQLTRVKNAMFGMFGELTVSDSENPFTTNVRVIRVSDWFPLIISTGSTQ